MTVWTEETVHVINIYTADPVFHRRAKWGRRHDTSTYTVCGRLIRNSDGRRNTYATLLHSQAARFARRCTQCWPEVR